MPKESNNLSNKKPRSSKPYDVSNSSFVQRATSRVLDFLPQTTWFSRWLAPSSEAEFLPTMHSPESVKLITSRSDLNIVNNPSESVLSLKRPTVHVNSMFNSPSNLITSKACVRTENEELSPIMSQSVATTSKKQPIFTFSSLQAPSAPHLENKLNGGDDCSETSESTSGCSSLVPQAQSTINQRLDDLNASSLNRSILSKANNSPFSFYKSSLNGRRPTFNTSTFSTTSKGSIQNRAGSSPFYSGRTMFGGASANSSVNCMSTRRLGPTVRPLKPKNEEIPLSSTAKKILDALEQFSTPILDAKRIPVTVGTKRRGGANVSKRFTELSVPTTSDLLRVKRRERLQKSTFDARLTSEISNNSVANSSVLEYKLSEHEFSQYKSDKNPGKLKTKWKERPQARENREEVVDFKLPNVKLPLTSLPSIDIKISSLSSKIADSKENSHFLFSLPLQDKCKVNKVCTQSTVNFKFSDPVSDSRNECTEDEINSTTGRVAHKCTDIDSNSSLSPGDSWKCDKCFVNNSKMVLKCLGCQNDRATKEGKTSPITMKKCSKCFQLAELEENICSYCQKVKVPSTPSDLGLDDKFKKPLDSWECEFCWVINGKEITKCLSCGNDKGGKPMAESGFGDKFKPSLGCWECKSCLLINKAEITICAACETPKLSNDNTKKQIPTSNILPSDGFKNVFKNSPGTWECDTCLVRNNSDKVKCVACETPKVSEKKPSPISQFSFGIPKGTEGASAGFKFGGFNTETDKSKTTTFSFGIPNDAKSSNSPKATPNFQFGLSNQNVSGVLPTSTFSFGIPKTDSINVESNGNTSMKTSECSPLSNQSNSVVETEVCVVTSDIVSEKLVEPEKPNVTPTSISFTPSSMFSFQSSNITSTSKMDKKADENKIIQLHDNSFSVATPVTTTAVQQNSVLELNSFNNTKNEISISSKESKPISVNDNKNSLSAVSEYKISNNPVSSASVNEQTISLGSKSSTFALGEHKELSSNNFAAQNVFGNNDSSTVQKSIANVFGSASTTMTSTFGATATPASLITFNKPVEQASGFGFAPAQPTNPGFTFNNVQSNNSKFNFNPKAESKIPTFSSNFGSVQNATNQLVFGGLQQQQPTSNFGEAPSQSTVFAFGNGSQTTNSVFGGFGTSQNSTPQSSTPSPAFVFGATPVPNPVPAFDPNAKPTFNFTGGAQPSTFTATSSTSVTPAPNNQRKIRKAVRRQPRPN